MARINDSVIDRERVGSKLARLIKEFCCVGREFHMNDLNTYIIGKSDEYVAPDSPGRIMRMMKQQGVLNYRVISRSESKYEVLPGAINAGPGGEQ